MSSQLLTVLQTLSRQCVQFRRIAASCDADKDPVSDTSSNVPQFRFPTPESSTGLPSGKYMALPSIIIIPPPQSQSVGVSSILSIAEIGLIIDQDDLRNMATGEGESLGESSEFHEDDDVENNLRDDFEGWNDDMPAPEETIGPNHIPTEGQSIASWFKISSWIPCLKKKNKKAVKAQKSVRFELPPKHAHFTIPEAKIFYYEQREELHVSFSTEPEIIVLNGEKCVRFAKEPKFIGHPGTRHVRFARSLEFIPCPTPTFSSVRFARCTHETERPGFPQQQNFRVLPQTDDDHDEDSSGDDSNKAGYSFRGQNPSDCINRWRKQTKTQSAKRAGTGIALLAVRLEERKLEKRRLEEQRWQAIKKAQEMAEENGTEQKDEEAGWTWVHYFTGRGGPRQSSASRSSAATEGSIKTAGSQKD